MAYGLSSNLVCMIARKASMRFDKPIIVVGHADVNKALLSLMAEQFAVVALDGGLDIVTSLGLEASLVIGDMDSVRTADLAGAQMTITEQDSNDFEKALYSLEAPLIIGFGLFGKRFDHTMANLQLMAKYHDRQAIMAVTDHEVITLHHGTQNLLAVSGQTVAVLPLMPLSFASSQGLLYPLDGLHLSLTEMVSSSNQADADQIVLMPMPEDEGAFYAVCRSLTLLERYAISDLYPSLRLP